MYFRFRGSGCYGFSNAVVRAHAIADAQAPRVQRQPLPTRSAPSL
jgi:hypothetical protein